MFQLSTPGRAEREHIVARATPKQSWSAFRAERVATVETVPVLATFVTTVDAGGPFSFVSIGEAPPGEMPELTIDTGRCHVTAVHPRRTPPSLSNDQRDHV